MEARTFWVYLSLSLSLSLTHTSYHAFTEAEAGFWLFLEVVTSSRFSMYVVRSRLRVARLTWIPIPHPSIHLYFTLQQGETGSGS